jgi:hypothetical protein
LRRRTRLAVEQLEDRTVPSNYPVANVDQLIAAINTANQTPEADTIVLVAGTTYTLTQGYHTDHGDTGLPTIAAAGGPLTIQGNGDTIERGTASGTPAFRLFDVAVGASLTLANVAVQGGLVYGAGGGIYSSGSLTLEAGTIISGNEAIGLSWSASAKGGGLYVAGGTATLSNVTLSSNSARGVSGVVGVPGEGGGLYVAAGAVTLDSATVSSNSAVGGDSSGTSGFRVSGAPANGGGLCVAGGMVSLTNVTLSSNSAVGGNSPYGGGSAVGGGLDAYGGTVTLRNDTVTGNSVQSGTAKNGHKGVTRAGGICIDSTYNAAATVYLDAFTLKNTKANTGGNIYGSYILI